MNVNLYYLTDMVSNLVMYKIKCSQTPPTLNLYIASWFCGLAERNEGMVLGVQVLCANRLFVGNTWAFLCWHSHTYLSHLPVAGIYISKPAVLLKYKYTWELRAVLNLLIEIRLWVRYLLQAWERGDWMFKNSIRNEADSLCWILTWLHRIGSRSFTDEGRKKHFFSLTMWTTTTRTVLLPMSWYHPAWHLETLPLPCVATAVLFSTTFLKVEVLFTYS